MIGVVLLAVDYRAIAASSRWLYAVNIVLLAAVLVLGRTSLGAQRWIALGPLGEFQPSEFAKLVIVITLAKHLADRPGPYGSIRDLLPFLGHIALPMLLIFRQPDLGTALVYGAIFVGMLYAGGARRRDLALLAAAALAARPAAVAPAQGVPAAAPAGVSGSVARSARVGVRHPAVEDRDRQRPDVGQGVVRRARKTSCSSCRSTTPTSSFRSSARSWGSSARSLLLGLFLVWLWRGARIASAARDRFGALAAVGVVSMVAFHVFVNVGMTVGIMPITGIPLPFISYGGSALMTMLWATALVLNIGMRRQKILF